MSNRLPIGKSSDIAEELHAQKYEENRGVMWRAMSDRLPIVNLVDIVCGGWNFGEVRIFGKGENGGEPAARSTARKHGDNFAVKLWARYYEPFAPLEPLRALRRKCGKSGVCGVAFLLPTVPRGGTGGNYPSGAVNEFEMRPATGHGRITNTRIVHVITWRPRRLPFRTRPRAPVAAGVSPAGIRVGACGGDGGRHGRHCRSSRQDRLCSADAATAVERNRRCARRAIPAQTEIDAEAKFIEHRNRILCRYNVPAIGV